MRRLPGTGYVGGGCGRLAVRLLLPGLLLQVPACPSAGCTPLTRLPPPYPPAAGADVERMQGVLCWQAGMLGAALAWLGRCGDVPRVNEALAPLAAAVSEGRVSEEQAAALDALQPVLETLPPGSCNAALLSVHRLLKGGTSSGSGSGGMHAAVAALAQLPEAMRDSCLQLVCTAVPVMPPGELSERDVLYLLQWLLVGAAFVLSFTVLLMRAARLLLPWGCAGCAHTHLCHALPAVQNAEGRLPPGKQGSMLAAAVQTARLALVRSLAASHMKQPPVGQQ